MERNQIGSEAIASLAYGKNISDYAKKLIYYCIHGSVKDEVIISSRSYDEIMDKFGFTKTKQLVNYIMSNYGLNKLNYSLFQVYSKIKPLDTPNDWFNTARLNGICSSYCMVMWNQFDKITSGNDILYTVPSNPIPINQSIELNYDRVRSLLVNELRSFIIQNDIYQSSDYSSVRPREMTSKDICDECYLHYPFYWGGAHGCDIFEIDDHSLSIPEIKAFMLRYPSSIIGYIINTCTYREGGGEHWTAMLFHKGTVYFICSFGSSMNCLHDNGKLYKTLMENGFAIRYNTQRLQRDHHTCGMYSALSCYLMLCTGCNLESSIEKLGVNGGKLVSGKNIQDFVEILA